MASLFVGGNVQLSPRNRHPRSGGTPTGTRAVTPDPRLHVVREGQRRGFLFWRRGLYTVYRVRGDGYREEIVNGWFTSAQAALAGARRVLESRGGSGAGA